MIRSEYSANISLQAPRALPTWAKPAPVRANRVPARSLFARIFGG